MTSIWRHLRFLKTIAHISYSIEPTNFVLGTNTQQYNDHLIMKIKMTLTDDEGLRRRSKVTKKWTNGDISKDVTLIDIIPGTKVQYNKRHLMT